MSPWRGLIAVLLLAGCGDVLSSEVETVKMRADLELRAWADGSAAMGIALKTRRPFRKWVELDSGDAVWATYDDEPVLMYEEQQRKKHMYVAWFDDIGEGDQVQVSLQRPNDADAPDSFAELPGAFEMGLSDTEIEMGWEGLDIAWWPTSTDPRDQMRLEVTGSCISDIDKRIDDDGSHYLNSSAFEPWDDEDPDSCSVLLELRREREGILDPIFKGGDAIGAQIRTESVWVDSWGGW